MSVYLSGTPFITRSHQYVNAAAGGHVVLATRSAAAVCVKTFEWFNHFACITLVTVSVLLPIWGYWKVHT
jgi:hypothetical protein